MKTFKIDIKKFDTIADESEQSKARGEMFDLVNTNRVYYIDEYSVMMFLSDGSWFEAMEFGVTVFYYTMHDQDSEDDFYQSFKHMVKHVVEVVDRDKIIESVKVAKFGEKVHIEGETYNGYKIDKEDLPVVKDLFQSGSFSEYSIMDMFGIDRGTLYMIAEDDNILIEGEVITNTFEMLIPKDAIDSDNTGPFMESMLNRIVKESESFEVISFETGANKDFYKYVISHQYENAKEITQLVKEMFTCAVLTQGVAILLDETIDVIDHVDMVKDIQIYDGTFYQNM